jgi:hypothetical protein
MRLLLLLLYLWKFNYRLEVGNLYNLTMILKIWLDDARVDCVTKGGPLMTSSINEKVDIIDDIVFVF